MGKYIVAMSKADHRWFSKFVEGLPKQNSTIVCKYFMSLAVTEVWQSSINSSMTGAEVLGYPQQVCSQTKTAGVDDDPFFAIDFGKNISVSHIAFFPPYPASGKQFILFLPINCIYTVT